MSTYAAQDAWTLLSVLEQFRAFCSMPEPAWQLISAGAQHFTMQEGPGRSSCSLHAWQDAEVCVRTHLQTYSVSRNVLVPGSEQPARQAQLGTNEGITEDHGWDCADTPRAITL